MLRDCHPDQKKPEQFLFGFFYDLIFLKSKLLTDLGKAAGSPEASGLPSRPLKALNESSGLFFIQNSSNIAGSPDALGLPPRPKKPEQFLFRLFSCFDFSGIQVLD